MNTHSSTAWAAGRLCLSWATNLIRRLEQCSSSVFEASQQPFSAATDIAYSNMVISAAGSPATPKKSRKRTTTRGRFFDGFDGRVALTEVGAVCTAASLPILGNTSFEWMLRIMPYADRSAGFCAHLRSLHDHQRSCMSASMALSPGPNWASNLSGYSC